MREDAILHKMQTGDPSGLESLMDIYIPYVSTVVWNILYLMFLLWYGIFFAVLCPRRTERRSYQMYFWLHGSNHPN